MWRSEQGRTKCKPLSFLPPDIESQVLHSLAKESPGTVPSLAVSLPQRVCFALCLNGVQIKLSQPMPTLVNVRYVGTQPLQLVYHLCVCVFGFLGQCGTYAPGVLMSVHSVVHYEEVSQHAVMVGLQ